MITLNLVCDSKKHVFQRTNGDWFCTNPGCSATREYTGRGNVLREQTLVCVECGDDLACEGYNACSDCLELNHSVRDFEAEKRILALQILESMLAARLVDEDEAAS